MKLKVNPEMQEGMTPEQLNAIMLIKNLVALAANLNDHKQVMENQKILLKIGQFGALEEFGKILSVRENQEKYHEYMRLYKALKDSVIDTLQENYRSQSQLIANDAEIEIGLAKYIAAEKAQISSNSSTIKLLVPSKPVMTRSLTSPKSESEPTVNSPIIKNISSNSCATKTTKTDQDSPPRDEEKSDDSSHSSSGTSPRTNDTSILSSTNDKTPRKNVARPSPISASLLVKQNIFKPTSLITPSLSSVPSDAHQKSEATPVTSLSPKTLPQRPKLALLTRQLTQPVTPSSSASPANTVDTAVSNAEKHSPPSTASQTKQNPEATPAAPQPQQRVGNTTERMFPPLKARRMVVVPVATTTSDTPKDKEKEEKDNQSNSPPSPTGM